MERATTDYPRDSAAALLGAIGPAAEPAVPALLRVLTREPAVSVLDYGRVAAAKALGDIGASPERVVPALVAALASDKDDLRGAAIDALGRFGPRAKAAAPVLWEVARGTQKRAGQPVMLTDLREPGVFREWKARVAAVSALARLGEDPRGTIAGLLEPLRGASGEARRAALAAVGDLAENGGPAVTLLVQAFREFKDDRVAVATLLGTLGPAAREALPALEEAARQGPPEVRDAASAAIKRITEPKPGARSKDGPARRDG